MSLWESQKNYMEGFEGWKGKEELMKFYYKLKSKRENGGKEKFFKSVL